MSGRSRKPPTDHGLDTLLALHDTIYEVGGGYWAKITARRIEPDARRPHGIDYSLTLHAPSGKRVLGYDNAHPVDAGGGPGRRKKHGVDHKHAGKSVRPYGYTDAGTLMSDFWADIERFLKAEGIE